jgi:hypothetical protein
VSDKLKLYHAVNSPNSRRVRIFLAEKGLKPTAAAPSFAILLIAVLWEFARPTVGQPSTRISSQSETYHSR